MDIKTAPLFFPQENLREKIKFVLFETKKHIQKYIQKYLYEIDPAAILPSHLNRVFYKQTRIQKANYCTASRRTRAFAEIGSSVPQSGISEIPRNKIFVGVCGVAPFFTGIETFALSTYLEFPPKNHTNNLIWWMAVTKFSLRTILLFIFSDGD